MTSEGGFVNKLLITIGILLAVISVITLAMYGWNGHWFAIIVAIAATPLGKLILGLVELILLPLSIPAISLAKRRHDLLSTCLMGGRDSGNESGLCSILSHDPLLFHKYSRPSFLDGCFSFCALGECAVYSDYRARN
jgi:hypothetical protein